MSFGRLDRYVTLAVVGAYAAALVFLGSMFVLFDLLFEMQSYMASAEKSGIGIFELALMIGEYQLMKMPIVFVTIAPFVTVIAAMFALSKLMASNEIGPMLFTGRSLSRILVPMLSLALFSALAMAGTWQWLIPSLAPQYEKLHAKLKDDDVKVKRVTLRARDNQNQELFCLEYDREHQKMRGLIVFQSGSSHGDGIYLEASEAFWHPERKDWELKLGRRRTGTDDRIVWIPQRWLSMPGVTPKIIMDSGKLQKETSTMSYTELVALMDTRPGKTDYVLAFHVHFTFPLANLVLVLLALPFAVNFEQGRRVERVVFAISICAGYLIVDLICQNLAFNNYIHPIVAAWTPTIVFGSLGVVVFGGMRS